MSNGHTESYYAESGAALAYFTQPKRSGLLIDAGPVFWAVLCGAVLIAAISAGTGLMISNFRDRALIASETHLENTVRLLAGHFDHQLDDFESVHKSVAAEIRGQIASPG